jgi:hypothetical protein
VELVTWAVVIAVGLYGVECMVWPYRRCWPCKGTGKLFSPVTRSWRDCRCGGDGRAIRWGRRMFEGARKGLR